MKRAHIFNIPASAPFAQVLAKGLIARVEKEAFALSDCVIYLPTRRAARNFGEAFAGLLGGAALLPQFRALGDSEEEDIAFDAAISGADLPPAISPIRRQLLLANLVREWDVQGRDGTLTFAQAAALADSLAKVMDETEREGADLGRITSLAPEALSEHWQQVTRFLDVIHARWPAILAAEGKLNPAARTNRMLALLAEKLAAHPPAGMVIAAGSTGSIPATARLLSVIAGLERGAVVLPGLDPALDEKSWNDLDPRSSPIRPEEIAGAAGSGPQRRRGLAGLRAASRPRNAAARKPASRADHRCLARHRRARIGGNRCGPRWPDIRSRQRSGAGSLGHRLGLARNAGT